MRVHIIRFVINFWFNGYNRTNGARFPPHRTARGSKQQHVISVLVTVPLLCVCVSMCVSRAVDTQKYPVSKSLAATFPSVSCAAGISCLDYIQSYCAAYPRNRPQTGARTHAAVWQPLEKAYFLDELTGAHASTQTLWRYRGDGSRRRRRRRKRRVYACAVAHTHTHLTGVWVGCKWVVRLLVWFTRKPKVRLIQSTAYENICQPSEMYSCGRIREHLGCGQGH